VALSPLALPLARGKMSMLTISGELKMKGTLVNIIKKGRIVITQKGCAGSNCYIAGVVNWLHDKK
jgi:hypothetical protein